MISILFKIDENSKFVNKKVTNIKKEKNQLNKDDKNKYI